jgi:predicted NBD/HSP70 family sugar kinase
MIDGKVSGQRGQPASRLRLNPDGAYAFGLNVDRDHLILVVVDLVGRICHRSYRHITYPLPRDVIEFVLVETKRIFDDGIAPRDKVLGLGLAIPDGIWHQMNSETPESYEQWKAVDIATICGQLLGLPVWSENDASAAAIGEHKLGKGAAHHTFLYIVITAGLGCGLIINGRPFIRGMNHAGEIGNIPIARAEKGQGILWDVVSIFGLYEVFREHGLDIPKPDEIAEGNKKMLKAVDAWIDGAVAHILPTFLTINYVISPEVVYIGGHLPAFVVDRLCTRLNAAMGKHRVLMPVTHFERSTHLVDAAAIGASTLVFSARLMP